MATTSTLKMTFVASNGGNTSLSYANSKDAGTLSSTNVKALMEGIIANGAIFENVPVSMKSAEITKKETTAIDLS